MQLVPAVFGGPVVISGTKLVDTIGIVPQGGVASSLVAQLSGKIVGDVSGGTLTINSQSLVVGLENPLPPFVPSSAETGSFGQVDVFGGEAVSNIGGPATEANIAVRNLALRPLGGSVTVGAAAASINFQVVSGFLDFKTTADPPNSFFYPLPFVVEGPVTNSSAQPVTGSLSGTIQIPFSVEYVFDAIVSQNPLIIVPDGGRVNLVGTVSATRLIPGDFDGNQIVESADLAQWSGDFGANPDSDADLDGDSDGADFLIWQKQYGVGSAAVGAGAVVPEPGAAVLALAAAIGICAARRGR